MDLTSDLVSARPALPSSPAHPASPAGSAGAPRGAGGSSDAITTLLRQRFGIEKLRDFQREAIDALLHGSGRVLLVAPTGGGKSLAYQVPAAALPGTALVLSPLISLMEDQVRALEARGIPATLIASSVPREENARRLAGLRRGDYKLVYAAPERLAFDGFLDALADSRLSLVAVDEAHCIVQWGHDFRPDYLRIGEALERLQPARVLACTATATESARDEIVRRLGWAAPGREPEVILRGFARPNLHLSVREVSGPREAFAEVSRALASALGAPARPAGAGIVYAATRRYAETIADKLAAAGWPARAYHAGLDARTRAEISAAFADRKLPVVVATNAFGMGIDRPDVRVVVHAQPPASIEAYYQEVGRAGRDGGPAEGLLCFAGVDLALRRRMCSLGEGGGPASAADAARAWGQFRELLAYVDAATCRHDFILRHFGDEAESLGGCGHCDVCREVDALTEAAPAELEGDLDTVRRALAGVARTKGAAGMLAIAAMLVGETTARVSSARLDRLSTFGVLAGRTSEAAMAVLRVLLANGWIDLTTNEYPVPLITEAGWRVMRGEEKPRVRLPAPKARRPRRRSVERGGASSISPRPPAVAGGEATGSAGKASVVELALTAGMDRGLFEALRTHRAGLAREAGLPAYVIAPDRTLCAIALQRPRSRGEIAALHGMGPARVTAYGDGFLEVVSAHRAEANEGPPAAPSMP